MLLFRSEEHVESWCRNRGDTKGAVLGLVQLWRLAQVWHGERLNPEWRRPTAEESQEIFRSIGLTGTFWQVT